jgi:dolichol-phosphate mannosyltransferase
MGEGTEGLLVLIPAYDEPEGLRLVLKEILGSIDPLVLVVSRPPGHIQGKIAESLGATVFEQESKGKGTALREALEYIEKKHYSHEYLAIIDADYTYPVNHLNDMLEILRENPRVGMVTGNRFPNWIKDWKSGFRALMNPYYAGNKILSLFHRVLNGIDMSDPFTGLRAIRYPLIKDWRPKSKSFDIECELNDFVLNEKGCEIVEIPIEYRERVGKKKLGMRHGFTILHRIFSITLNRLRERV